MKKLEKDIRNLYRSLINKEFIAKQVGEAADPSYRLSAMNLVRYITLRNQDLRNVHDHLSELGISSLRSCEGYVMDNVTSVLRIVKLLNEEKWTPPAEVETIGYKASKKLLKKHTKQLFNTKKRNRDTMIMVTVPREAAFDPDMIRQLIVQGMEIARINLCEGSPVEWMMLIDNVKEQRDLLGLDCKIYMDLSGPKFKVGKIEIEKETGKIKKFIRLHKGDHLVLSSKPSNTKDIHIGSKGQSLINPVVSVSNAAIVNQTQIGDQVIFDNGKIVSRIIKKRKDEIEVIIISEGAKGNKLKSEATINLPDTQIQVASLTTEDIKQLPLVIEHADIIGYPYVRTTDDIKALYKELDKYKGKDVGIVIKIENEQAFENLPVLLLEAMKRPRIGVMIARGNLAVEIGADRIAEVQDQIMWICEAAHIPVIWATQVLENLTSTGIATRAEITDAAKSARAECVMLNRGPHVKESVIMLSKILEKMEGHTSKKKSVMRALKVSMKNIDRIGK